MEVKLVHIIINVIMINDQNLSRPRDIYKRTMYVTILLILRDFSEDGMIKRQLNAVNKKAHEQKYLLSQFLQTVSSC
jgi:hypothetical protein